MAWVVIPRDVSRPAFETFGPFPANIDPAKALVLEAGDYLARFNAAVKAAGGQPPAGWAFQ
jgi:hypothetical protein